MSVRRPPICALAAALAVVAPLVFSLGSARAVPTELFISEYIEGSSNNKAIEIYNGTGAPIDLAAEGYLVQVCFNGSAACALTIMLTGTVAAEDVYVLAQASAGPAILAQADQTNGSGWFNGNDAVVLLRGATVVDSIGQRGFNPGTEWGTGLTSTADNTLRRKPTVQSGDTNTSDVFDPALEWEGFPLDTFDGLGSHTITTGGDTPPAVAATSPAGGATEVPVDSNVEITFSEDVVAAPGWYSISCSMSGDHSATQSGGPRSFALNPDSDFAEGEECTVTITASAVADQDTDDPPNEMAANHTFSFRTTLPVTQIAQVQGPGHRSAMAGQQVKVEGVVTFERGSSVWVQDPTPDSDDRTSEGILVFGSSVAAAVAVGDLAQVRGTVTEFRPGCPCPPTSSAFANLTTTELASPGLGAAVISSGNGLPTPTVIGSGGRVPPATVIEDDATGDVEASGIFDPVSDGIDFYETLEAMRVQVNDPVAVGPRNQFGEVPVLADDGAGSSVRTARGGIVIRAEDFNPERITLDDTFLPTPVVNVGDGFTSAAVGLMDYSFANFKLNVTSPLTRVDGGLERETTAAPVDQEIAIATFNVENLDPGDGPKKFEELARLIVDNLKAPDLLGLEEVQDSNGPVNDAVTDATLTYQTLIAAIQAAGGPLYQFRQINPVDDQDGGEPGGNIRVGFLFRTDRGLSFVDRPGGSSTTPTTVVNHPSGPRLSVSPGRIAPASPAFNATRKSLVGEFRARGKKLFVIVNHFSSKGGDQPLFGRFQPPTRFTEVARHAQAQVVNDFVDEILAADADADVVVLGDINDFEFSETVAILEGGVLENLMNTLPKEERYSYVFEGNSQVLDQILVSERLFGFPLVYDVVHVNSEFAVQASDHEPQVARFRLIGEP